MARIENHKYSIEEVFRVGRREGSLSPALLAGQRLRLYAMAALFFVLLYTFPAGMVLYWTTNNLLHLGKILLARVLPAAR